MLLTGLGTWGAFLTGVLFAVIGVAIGLVVEGRVDLGAILDQEPAPDLTVSGNAGGATALGTLPPPSGSAPLPSPGPWTAEDEHDDGTAGAASATPVEQRGTVRLAPRVVARLAEVAASRVPGVLRDAPAREVIVGADPLAAPAVGTPRALDATASVDEHGRAHVRLVLGIAWPEPVAEVVAAVARAVVDEVRRLAGVEVASMDVEVARIAAPPKRRVR